MVRFNLCCFILHTFFFSFLFDIGLFVFVFSFIVRNSTFIVCKSKRYPRW